MSSNTKNFTEQGGERTFIGGVLEFGDQAEIRNMPGGGGGDLPVATRETLGGVKVGDNLSSEADGKIFVTPMENLPSSAAADVGELAKHLNKLLVRLKDNGLMLKDDWNVESYTVGQHSEPAMQANNELVYYSRYQNDKLTITGAFKRMTEFAYGDEAENVHKWFCVSLCVGTLLPVTDVFVNGVRRTSRDVAEARACGCRDGSFLLYLKADEIGDQGLAFVLTAGGYPELVIPVEFVNRG